MEKVVIVKFPDDFEFPKTFMEKNIKDRWFNYSTCEKCLLSAEDNVNGVYCLPLGLFGYEGKGKACPFSNGEDIALIEERMY